MKSVYVSLRAAVMLCALVFKNRLLNHSMTVSASMTAVILILGLGTPTNGKAQGLFISQYVETNSGSDGQNE